MQSDITQHRVPRQPFIRLGLFALSQAGVAALWWFWGWEAGVTALLITHAAVFWSTFYPRSQLFCPVLSRLSGDAPRVWLTLDDGPSDDTLPMLDLLDEYNSKATFFVVGKRVRARPELVREIVRRGHELGNHSDSHPNTAFWRIGPKQLEREISATQATLFEMSGRVPRWFRSVAGHSNPLIAPVLARHHLTRVAWSARGFDGVSCTPDGVLKRLVPNLVPGAIVLLHEGAAHGHNVEILRRVLEQLQQRGLRAELP